MREPLRTARISLLLTRITPAYAGTTYFVFYVTLQAQDHPRVCGNHVLENRKAGKNAGSPPRMREPLLFNASLTCSSRITPAYAGTTCLALDICSVNQDHPRVCGNHGDLSERQERIAGSPPRMREPLSFILGLFIYGRITPAYAGTTMIYNLTFHAP